MPPYYYYYISYKTSWSACVRAPAGFRGDALDLGDRKVMVKVQV